MSMRAEQPKDEDAQARLMAMLVRRLHRTEQRLHELTRGQVDAVLHPHGQSYLLRNAQEQLRGSTGRLRTILRSISDAVIAVDVDERVEMLNPRAEQLIGWPESDAR